MKVMLNGNIYNWQIEIILDFYWFLYWSWSYDVVLMLAFKGPDHLQKNLFKKSAIFFFCPWNIIFKGKDDNNIYDHDQYKNQ